MSIRILPSILSADFGRLESEILEVASADFVHVDVMDNHFVPNLTIGLPVVQRLAQISPIPLDVHLMISDPDRWAAKYADVGVASCTFHFEAAKNPLQVARDIRSTGSRAAVAIKPGTPAEAVFDLLTEVDMVLVMTVEPGFGGQKFMPEVLPKLGALRKAAAEAGTDIWLEVDGGISVETAPEAVAAGADTLVAGSSVFGHADRAAAIANLRAAVR
jgi:ribulose-phosphate 3-epimerase